MGQLLNKKIKKAVLKELWREFSLGKRNPVAYLGDLPISCAEVA